MSRLYWILPLAAAVACGAPDDGIAPLMDVESRAVAHHVPSFGGAFIDDEGVLTAYVLDPSVPGLKDRVLDVLLDTYGDDLGERVAVAAYRRNLDRFAVSAPSGDDGVLPVEPAPFVHGVAPVRPPLVLRRGTYTIDQLAGWHVDLLPLVGADGVVSTSIAHPLNRLEITVESDDAADVVDDRLIDLGVPRDAVRTVLGTVPQPDATLRDDLPSPFQGGIEIGHGLFSACTMGFNARRGSRVGFVTNAHCTNTIAQLNNDPFWQPARGLWGAGSPIGTEQHDPAASTCPSGTGTCLRADAAFVEYASSGYSGGAYLKQTTNWNGSITISTSQPRFHITSKHTSLLAGEALDKVARTTGWRWGFVSSTCVNIGQQNSPHTFLCQGQVTGTNIRAGGDSGGPWFRWSGTPVAIAGVHWGGTGNVATFSKIGDVEAHLGVESVNNVGNVPPFPTCPNSGDTCCYVNHGGNCVCRSNPATCPPNPDEDCPPGDFCCWPDATGCAYCADSLADCPPPF